MFTGCTTNDSQPYPLYCASFVLLQRVRSAPPCRWRPISNSNWKPSRGCYSRVSISMLISTLWARPCFTPWSCLSLVVLKLILTLALSPKELHIPSFSFCFWTTITTENFLVHHLSCQVNPWINLCYFTWIDICCINLCDWLLSSVNDRLSRVFGPIKASQTGRAAVSGIQNCQCAHILANYNVIKWEIFHNHQSYVVITWRHEWIIRCWSLCQKKYNWMLIQILWQTSSFLSSLECIAKKKKLQRVSKVHLEFALQKCMQH